MSTITAAEVVRILAGPSRSAEENEYIRFHAPRFAYVVGLLDECLDKLGATAEKPARFLDISPHLLTQLVAERFGPRVVINTLGWEQPHLYDVSRVKLHIPFDLNDAYETSRWVLPEQHDLLLAAEVIEHLYTAPEQVLAYLRELTRPGGMLIIQTPNAASLRNRLLLASGRNPYERIRTDRTNPGHYREYTLDELVSVGKEVGFEVERASHEDYFRSHPALRAAGAVMPSLRRGLTLILRRR